MSRSNALLRVRVNHFRFSGRSLFSFAEISLAVFPDGTSATSGVRRWTACESSLEIACVNFTLRRSVGGGGRLRHPWNDTKLSVYLFLFEKHLSLSLFTNDWI